MTLERKKPSERIKEIWELGYRFYLPGGNFFRWIFWITDKNRKFEALLEYLDEQDAQRDKGK